MIEAILTSELEQLRTHIANRIQSAGKSATGSAIASLSHRLEPTAQGWQATFSGAPHLATLERGQPPGSQRGQAGNGDFVQSLRRWIVARGIPYKDSEDLERLARFFQWYISAYGSQQYRAGQTLDIIQTPIHQLQERLTQRIAQAASQQLTETLLNNL